LISFLVISYCLPDGKHGLILVCWRLSCVARTRKRQFCDLFRMFSDFAICNFKKTSFQKIVNKRLLKSTFQSQ